MAVEPQLHPASSAAHQARPNSDTEDSPGVLLLAGPTAVGKSEVALLLAEMLDGEIITVDSMQVYRGLDIGTAKPSAAERARVPHHLLDVAELTEPFDAARFAMLARQAVKEIQARGRLPILCGGTGLYFKAFLAGLGEAPPSDRQLRATLRATPLPDLLRELSERDPVLYGQLDRQNPRRVIRALEIARLTGKPASTFRADWKAGPESDPKANASYGLSRAPEDLRTRIDKRVDDMFRRGLVTECERLLREGLQENETAMQALGYRQVVEYLKGERSLSDTVKLIKTRTHRFAKRQMTWFRRQEQLSWIHLEAHTTAQEAAITIAKNLSR